MRKEIDILQKTKTIVVENMMEAQRRFQELIQLDVQRITSTTTSKDQELVEENSKLKIKIATLRKQL